MKKITVFNILRLIGATIIIFVPPVIAILAGVILFKSTNIIIDLWRKDTTTIVALGIILFSMCVWIKYLSNRIKWLERRKDEIN